MPKRMNWNRAKPFRPTEMKYDEGKILNNGVVVSKPLDNLAARAKKAERQWLKKNKMKTIYDRPPKKRKKRNRYRGPKLGEFHDIALDILSEGKK